MSKREVALRSIENERERQKLEEGWFSEHDDQWALGELVDASECYLTHALGLDDNDPPKNWPWDEKWWKPKTPMRDLERAGALLLAEKDRISRKLDLIVHHLSEQY